jgi:uncharacterized membrane protein YqjE
MKMEQVCIAGEFMLQTLTDFVSTFVPMLNTESKGWNIEQKKEKRNYIKPLFFAERWILLQRF